MEKDVKILLRYIQEGHDAALRDINQLQGAVTSLTSSIDNMTAAKRKSSDTSDEKRQLGIIESLELQYRELETAIKRATTTDDIKKQTAELEKLRAELDKVSGNTDKATSAFKGLVPIITAAFVVDKVVDFAKALFQAGANTESFRISLETMLNSKAKADKLSAEIVDLAKKTPFTLQELQDGTKALLAYGFQAEKIIPLTQTLGDISAGIGKDKLPQLTMALGQVYGNLKLMGQEANQFVQAGVPLFEELSKASHKSVGQLREDMSNGAISYQMVEDALKSMTQEGGRFYQLMERQSQSLEGKLSNLEDSFYQFKVQLMSVFADGTKAVLDFLTNGVNVLASKMIELKPIVNAVGLVFTSLFDVLSPVGVLLKVLASSLFGLSAESLTLKNVVEKLGYGIEVGLVSPLKLVAFVIGSVVEAIQTLYAGAKVLDTILSLRFSEMPAAWDNFKKKISETTDNMKNNAVALGTYYNSVSSMTAYQTKLQNEQTQSLNVQRASLLKINDVKQRAYEMAVFELKNNKDLSEADKKRFEQQIAIYEKEEIASRVNLNTALEGESKKSKAGEDLAKKRKEWAEAEAKYDKEQEKNAEDLANAQVKYGQTVLKAKLKYMAEEEKEAEAYRKRIAAEDEKYYKALQVLEETKYVFSQEQARREAILKGKTEAERERIAKEYDQKILDNRVSTLKAEEDAEKAKIQVLELLGLTHGVEYAKLQTNLAKLTTERIKAEDEASENQFDSDMDREKKKELLIRETYKALKATILDFFASSDDAATQSLGKMVATWFDAGEKIQDTMEELKKGNITKLQAVAAYTETAINVIGGIYTNHLDARKRQLEEELAAFNKQKEAELAKAKSVADEKLNAEKQAATTMQQALLYDADLRNRLVEDAKTRELNALHAKRDAELAQLAELAIQYAGNAVVLDEIAAKRAEVEAMYKQQEADVVTKYEDIKLDKVKSSTVAKDEASQQSADRQTAITADLAKKEQEIKEEQATKEKQIKAEVLKTELAVAKAQLWMSYAVAVAKIFAINPIAGLVASAFLLPLFMGLSNKLTDAYNGSISALIGGGGTDLSGLPNAGIDLGGNFGGGYTGSPAPTLPNTGGGTNPGGAGVEPDAGSQFIQPQFGGSPSSPDPEFDAAIANVEFGVGVGESGASGHEKPIAVTKVNGKWALVYQFLDGGLVRVAPKFHEGTEFVDAPLKINRDEIPAILKRGERVLTVGQNETLNGMTNADLVSKALMYESIHDRMQGLTPRALPDGINITQQMEIMNFSKRFDNFVNAFENQPQFHITHDERGTQIERRKAQSKTNYLNNRFSK